MYTLAFLNTPKKLYIGSALYSIIYNQRSKVFRPKINLVIVALRICYSAIFKIIVSAPL